MINSATQAYARTSRTGLSGRRLEAAALVRCANNLQRTLLQMADDPAPLIEALEANRKLWSIFSVFARDDDSALPLDLRQTLLKVAIGVFRRQGEIGDLYASEQRIDPEAVEMLVTINRTLAEALSGTP
jgi:flagellar biosynthesis regulator FlaF